MPKFKDEQLELIIMKCQKGDMSEFDKLYKHYYSTVYYTAFHFFNDYTRAQDALQNTFLEVYHKIETLQSPKSFSAWIRRITYHKCLNMIVYEKKDSLYYVQHTDTDITTLHNESDESMKQLSFNELHQAVIESLNLLDERKRMIGYLKFLENYTAKEISEVMEMNLDTVNTNIRRIRIYMKEFLEKKGYTGKEFLSAATISSLSLNYHDHLNQLKEIKPIDFKIPKKNGKIHSSFKGIKILGVGAICTSVAFSTYTVMNKDYLTEKMQSIFQVDTQISSVEYPQEITNQPINLKVVATNSNYDDILINNKKTTEVNSNGVYNVSLVRGNVVLDTKKINIKNIDTDEPHLVKKEELKKEVILHFDDNIAIDSTFVEVYGNDVLQEGYVLKKNTLTLKKELTISYRVRIRDTAKNYSEFYINFKD